MSKHTPEPWVRDRDSGIKCDIRGSNGRKIALCWGLSSSKSAMLNAKHYKEECDANALRIVSCVNACAGMEDPEKEIAELRKQRDELMDSINEIRALSGYGGLVNIDSIDFGILVRRITRKHAQTPNGCESHRSARNVIDRIIRKYK